MSDELRKLRDAVYDLATDEDKVFTNEEWYDRLWELLEPVMDARAGHTLDVHDAGEYRDPSTGEPVQLPPHRTIQGIRDSLDAAVNTVSDRKRDAERCPTTWNPGVWPYTTRCAWKAGHEGLRHVDRDGNSWTETVEQHRFSFEGSTSQLADHLVAEHGLALGTVKRWRDGLTEGDWTALDDIHRAAHES